MATADTLLVRPFELRTWQRDELVALQADSYAESVLGAAQDGLADYLGFDPFIHKVVRFQPSWSMPGGMPSTYQPWTALGAGAPIVQVSAASYEETEGYYTVSVASGARHLEVLTTDPLPPLVDLYQGWRSSQHSLDGAGETIDLTGLDDLEDLAALPPVVPSVIHAALCNAATYLARYATQAGMSSYTVDLGSQVKTVETVTPMNAANALSGRTSELGAIYGTCHRYRRLTV